MKKIFFFIIIAIFLSFFLSPFPVYSQAKEPGFFNLGKYQIAYDEFFKDDTDEDGIIDKTSYFKEGNLILTVWDNNQDGTPDLWFQYDDEEYLIVQASDLNADGRPDKFLHFDRGEKVIKKEGKEEPEEEQPSFERPIMPEEETFPYFFASDNGYLTLTIKDLELKAKDDGKLAWILTLTMKAEVDLNLFANKYWFFYPYCPEEDVYVSGDPEGISFEYPNNPDRNYDRVFTDCQDKWYYAGEEVSRSFTIPLCMDAYYKYDTTRVDLAQAVEYYLTPNDTVETLEWSFSSP